MNGDTAWFDIVLPTYNGSAFLDETLTSIQEQSWSRWRLLAIDDGSGDDTVEILESAASTDDRITVLRGGGLRAAGARMAAIEHGSAPWLAFVDQDDLWSPAKLDRQASLLAHPEVAAVHTAVQHIDSEGRRIPGGALEENHYRRRFANGSEGLDARQLAVRNSIRLSSSCVKRDVFDAIGGFDSSLDGGEDWSFWFRLAANGHRVAYLDQILTHRRVHGDNTSIRSRAPRRQGLLAAVDKVSTQHPDHMRWLTARRAIVTWGAAAMAVRDRRPSDAARLTGAAVAESLAGGPTIVARYGLRAVVRQVAPRLARGRRG